MKRIGIIPNMGKDKDLTMTKKIIKWFESHDFRPIVTPEVGKNLSRNDLSISENKLFQLSDYIVVLGGDGTLLKVAQKAAIEKVPIIGVNLGKLGFLTDIEKDTAIESFKKIVTKDYYIENRMMVEAQIISPGEKIRKYLALNDVSLTRASYSRMVNYKININGHYADTYPADGVVISTPTGSTAYNLSAGGPIVDPEANLMLITPICPHTIYSRTIIVSEKDQIDVNVPLIEGGIVALTVDGQKIYNVKENDTIRMVKSKHSVKLLKLLEYNFYDILRTKIVERKPSNK